MCSVSIAGSSACTNQSDTRAASTLDSASSPTASQVGQRGASWGLSSAAAAEPAGDDPAAAREPAADPAAREPAADPAAREPAADPAAREPAADPAAREPA